MVDLSTMDSNWAENSLFNSLLSSANNSLLSSANKSFTSGAILALNTSSLALRDVKRTITGLYASFPLRRVR